MKTNTQTGLIRTAILIVIGVLILSYLGFDLKSFIESDQTQSNLSYVWDMFLWIWDHIIDPVWTRYIDPVFSYLWSFIGPTLENFGEGSLNPFIDNPNAAPGVEF